MEHQTPSYHVAQYQYLFNIPRILLALALMIIHGLLAWKFGVLFLRNYQQQFAGPGSSNFLDFLPWGAFVVMTIMPLWAIYVDIQKFRFNHLIPTKRVKLWYNMYFFIAALEFLIIAIPLVLMTIMYL